MTGHGTRFEGKTGEEATEWLRQHEIQRVRIEWCDLTGQGRGKVFPVDHFLEQLSDGMPFCEVAMTFDQHSNPAMASPLAGAGGYANALARPDLTTLRLLNHEAATAFLTTDIEFMDGTAAAMSPRAILRKAIAQLSEEGLSARLAPEVEFYILTAEREQKGRGAPCYLTRDRATMQGDLDVVLDAVSPFFRVRAWQQEHGPAQFEINVEHEDILQAADAQFAARNVMKETATMSGFHITAMAKPFNGLNGSSCHLNVSLFDEGGANVFVGPDDPLHISPRCRNFIGGVLAHMDECAAIYLPNGNSYKRVVPHHFAPTSRAWGVENRSAAVRVINDSLRSTRVEFRVCGGDINPYLAIAALIFSGVDGMRKGINPGDPSTGDLDTQDVERITADWITALNAFEASRWIEDCFGTAAKSLYLLVKRGEYARYRATVTDVDLNEYIDAI